VARERGLRSIAQFFEEERRVLWRIIEREKKKKVGKLGRGVVWGGSVWVDIKVMAWRRKEGYRRTELRQKKEG